MLVYLVVNVWQPVVGLCGAHICGSVRLHRSLPWGVRMADSTTPRPPNIIDQIRNMLSPRTELLDAPVPSDAAPTPLHTPDPASVPAIESASVDVPVGVLVDSLVARGDHELPAAPASAFRARNDADLLAGGIVPSASVSDSASAPAPSSTLPRPCLQKNRPNLLSSWRRLPPAGS